MINLVSKDATYNLRPVLAGCKRTAGSMCRGWLSMRCCLWVGVFFSAAVVESARADNLCYLLGDWVLAPEELAGSQCISPSADGSIEGKLPAGCPADGNFCVASFSAGEQWVLKRPPPGAEADVVRDELRAGEVLAIRSTSAGRSDDAGRGTLHLTSPVLDRAQFDAIQSVRLWVKGDGTDRYLRVFVKDQNGEAFTHTRRLYLDFDEWMPVDLPFTPVERLLNHGGDRNGVMDPPLTVSHILVTKAPGKKGRQVGLDRLSVVGRLASKQDSSTERTSNVDARSVTSSLESEGILLSFKRDGAVSPIRPRRQYPLVINTRNPSSARIRARVEATVHRVFGETVSFSSPLEVPPESRKAITIPADLSVPGWYRVQACVLVGSLTANCVETDYLVWEPVGNTEPDEPVTFPGAYESADLLLSHLRQDLSTMRQAGVKVLRFPFRWKNIEQQRGKYRWSTYDRIFAECERAGIIPQPTVIQTPEWARKTVTDEYAKQSPAFRPPRDMAVFGRFMEVAARRYAIYSPYWEIWNEPSAPNYWVSGTPEEYVGLLRAGYDGIKKADAEARVLVGAMRAIPGPKKEYMRYVLEHGQQYFDILTVHSHGPVQRLMPEFEATMDLWRETVGGSVPVWLNESGVSVDPDRPDGDLLKASGVVKKMVVARAEGMRNFSWFNFRHLPASTALPYNNYSAVNGYGRLRPVVLAYNNANRWLRGARLQAPKGSTDRRLEVYTFRKGNRLVRAVWARDPEERIMLEGGIAGSPDRVRVIDMFGGPLPLAAGSDGWELPPGGYPVFVVEGT